MSLIFFIILNFNLSFVQAQQPVAGEAMPATPPALPPAPPAVPSNSELPITDQATMNPNSNIATPATEFVWDPTGKRDPFRPFKAPRVLRSDSETQIDPLVLLDLANVNLVAVLWNTAKPRAIIQDGTGARYTVFKNTKVGTNSGFVADIREGEIVVIETFDDGFGNVVKEPKVIEMKKNYPSNSKDKFGNLKEVGGQNAD